MRRISEPVQRAQLNAPDLSVLRRRKLRRGVVQSAIVALCLMLVIAMGLSLKSGLAERGVEFSFGFLAQPAGFEISEGFVPDFADGFGIKRFVSRMSNAQALAASVLNTLKLALLAILFSSVVGVVIGLGRLSTNWLVRQFCFHAVEFVRNTPLLIQVTFWYAALVIGLPSVTEISGFFGAVFIARQGVWVPALTWSPGPSSLSFVLLLAGIGALVTGILVPISKAGRLRRVLIGTGGVIAVSVMIFGGFVGVDYPQVGRFNASGGLRLSPEFSALLIATTLNTAAYLGEIVRGAIEAISKGQWEASAALGLTRRNTLKDVILPQVFRVILPGFGNQYISLAKNTSLGIAIGYPDLFNVFGTMANQSGRVLEGVLIAILIYIGISFAISAAVNALNARIRIKGR